MDGRSMSGQPIYFGGRTMERSKTQRGTEVREAPREANLDRVRSVLWARGYASRKCWEISHANLNILALFWCRLSRPTVAG